MIGFQGATISDNHSIIRDLGKRNLGGVILFDRHLATGSETNNITSPTQVKELTTALQEAADNRLLIGVDQEGGLVRRFKKKHGFPETPSACTLGKKGSQLATHENASLTADMLKKVGVNLNFAPVVDLNLNPTNPIIGGYERSFSAEVSEVISHSRAWVEEHNRHGIISCLKHFPGHGSSITDSHLGFVDISNSWHESELTPYKEAIKSKWVKAIMVGHLFNCSMDDKHPATLSSKILNSLLRQKLQFKGLIVSDDMQMKAISDRYGLSEACSKAIAAGIDLVIVGNNLSFDPHILEKLQEALLKAVENNVISETRITEAWTQVQKLKSHLTPRNQTS